MRKSLILLAICILPLAGCVQPNPTTTCAGVGAASGAALGAITDNNLAESALVGGALGIFAGNSGVCG
ncbi:MAG: hypothetical protein K9G71_10165 [Rhodobacteraceae bacterium]|nr:hypothetical protein [Paracoccaceae bacterium]MCF8514498.1 hypothetical protein [Paracoccaceae bacterium]MCF8518962.1 hypothetical protein [Paracoccaceae bacterium]